VVRYIILYGRTITNGVNIAEWSAIEAKMRVGFKSVPICLNLDFLRDSLAEFGLG
jgi:hypothetical protein